jgi:tetratricopeptide (TPR) repeat protein
MMDRPSRIKNLFEEGPTISRYPLIALCSLALLVIVLYGRTLPGPFVFDDTPNILENSHIRLDRLALGGLMDAAFRSPTSNRPVANLSLALNYYLNGYNVVGYRVVNIVIHIITGWLLFLLTKLTLLTPYMQSRRYKTAAWIPLATALIWLVHPIQTQAVAYVVQRMTSMATLFYILSMVFYVRWRLTSADREKPVLLAGCILSGIMALGTKEIAVTLPFFILLYEWYFFQDLNSAWLRRHGMIVAGLVLLMAALALVYLGTDPIGRVLAGFRHRQFTPAQRLLTQFRVVVFYISLLAWPHPSRLNLDHDMALSQSLFNPLTTLLSVVLVAGLVGLAVLTAKKQRLVSFAIFWFFGNLLLESSVLGLELVFEHRLYLPSAFVFFAVVTLAFEHISSKRFLVGLFATALAICCFWTYQRNAVWGDEVALWQDCVAKSPEKARPHNNLAQVLVERDLIEAAIPHLQIALKIKPDYEEAHYNLGYAYIRQDRLDAGIHHLNEALRLYPKNYMAHNNLGVAYLLQGRLREAGAHFEEAVRIKPGYAVAHNNLGVVLRKQGKLEAAARHFAEALRLDPANAQARRNLEETRAELRLLDSPSAQQSTAEW